MTNVFFAARTNEFGLDTFTLSTSEYKDFTGEILDHTAYKNMSRFSEDQHWRFQGSFIKDNGNVFIRGVKETVLQEFNLYLESQKDLVIWYDSQHPHSANTELLKLVKQELPKDTLFADLTAYFIIKRLNPRANRHMFASSTPIANSLSDARTIQLCYFKLSQL